MVKARTAKRPTMRKFKATPYLLLLPSMLIFLAFVYYPFLKTVFLSLTLTDAQGHPVKWVWFSNFVRIFNNKQFLNSLQVSFKFALLVGVPSLVFGFILALMAKDRVKGGRLHEALFALPMAVASAPAASIWFLIFTPNTGVLNYLLGTDVRWLLDKNIAIYAVAAVTVWMNMGVNFIFLLTGLRNIPEDLLESASIDGAGYFRRLFQIMIPVASPQIFFVVFLNIVSSFQAFAQIRLMTQGGPSYTTNVVVYSIYRAAFLDSRFETACAQSIVLFFIILIITRIQFAFEKRGVNYA